ncbi:MAG: hypothetical protein ACYCUI_09830 [Vulcanimicrobiaceae bacterium]
MAQSLRSMLAQVFHISSMRSWLSMFIKRCWAFMILSPEYTVVAVAMLAYIRSVNPTRILLGGDVDGSVLDPWLALTRALHAWSFHVGLGNDNTPAVGQIPIYAFESILHYVGLPLAAGQWITYGVVFLLIPSGMCLYARTVLPHRPLLVLYAALASVFNFYVALTWYTPVLPYAFAIIGALFASAALLRFARSISWQTSLVLIISALLAYDAGANAAIAAVMILTIGVLTMAGLSQQKVSWRRFVLGCVAFFGLSSAWLFPTVAFVIKEHSTVLAGSYVRDWTDGTLLATSASTTWQNAIRLIGSWNWDHSDLAGHAYVAYASWYSEDPVLFLLSFVVPVLAVLAFVGPKNRREGPWKLVIGISLLPVLIFMKGLGAPFGSLFAWFFTHVPGFLAFRDPYSKFGITAAVLMPLLAGYGANRALRAVPRAMRRPIGVGLVAAISCSLFPYFAGDMFRSSNYKDMPSYYVRIPAAYRQLAAYLNSIRSQSGRAIVLPFSPQISYTAFDWGFNGPDPLPYMVNRPLIVEDRSWSDPYTKIILSGISADPTSLEAKLGALNIKYAIVHQDIDQSFYGSRSAAQAEVLLKKAGATLVKTFGAGDLALYEFPWPARRDTSMWVDPAPISGRGLGAVAASLGCATVYEDIDDPPATAALQRVSRLAPGQQALAPLPLTMQLKNQVGSVAAVSNALNSSLPLADKSFAAVAINGEVIRNGAPFVLQPGRTVVLGIDTIVRENSNWTTIEHEPGVMFVDRLRIPAENAALIVTLSTPALAEHNVGVMVECCSGAHRKRLAADAVFALDGKKHTVVFPIRFRNIFDVRVGLYGDGAKHIALSKITLSVGKVAARYDVDIPNFLLVNAGGARVTNATDTLIRVSRHPHGSALLNNSDIVGLTTVLSNEKAASRGTYAVRLPMRFTISNRKGSIDLVPADSKSGEIAVPTWTAADQQYVVDATPVSLQSAIRIGSGLHEFIGAADESTVLRRNAIIGRVGKHSDIMDFPVDLPARGAWIVRMRYSIPRGADLGARYSWLGSHGVRHTRGDVALLADGATHEVAFRLATLSRINGGVDIYGHFGRAFGNLRPTFTIARIKSDVLYRVPTVILTSSQRLRATRFHSLPADAARLNRLRNNWDLRALVPLNIPQASSFGITVPSTGLLVFSVAYNPEWHATDKSGPLQEMLVDGAFPGWIVRGPGHIWIRYEIGNARAAGLWITVLTALGLLGLTFLLTAGRARHFGK